MSLRTYTATVHIALVLQDHDDTARALTNITFTELSDAIDQELPTTLWCEDSNGDEHGYDVKGSTVTVAIGPRRVGAGEVTP